MPATHPVLGFSTRLAEDIEPAEPAATLDPALATLARELVSDIHPAEVVLRRHGYAGASDPAWQRLARNPGFTALLETLSREWHGLDSTQKRVRAKALASVELAIPDWHRQMTDRDTAGGVKADLAKLMVAVAGVGTPPPGSVTQGGAAGFRLNIVINPPGQPQQVVTVAGQPALDARAEPAD